jgi:Flp pilus assembly protein TadG
MRNRSRVPIIHSVRRVAARDERGAAVVEFALVLPLLVLFTFGIIEFGRAYSAKIELTAAVREGARAAAIAKSACADPAKVQECVEEAVRGAASGIDTGSVTLDTAKTTLCDAVPTPTNAEVTATYPFHYQIPLFGEGTWTLHAKGSMRCGG